jgi:hypothetical protein
MTPLISAAERLYHELSQPKLNPPKPVQQPSQHRTAVTIARGDVDAILRHKRTATPEELQYILDHSEDFALRPWQRDQIVLQFTLTAAAKMRAAQGIREPENSFLYDTLKVAETPWGLLHDRQWVEHLMKEGTRAVWHCKNHRPPRCECWRGTRDILWNVRVTYGEQSPEAWAASRVWSVLEDLELVPRPGWN